MAEMICLPQGNDAASKTLQQGQNGPPDLLSVPRCQCRVVRGATGYRLLPAPVVSGNHQ